MQLRIETVVGKPLGTVDVPGFTHANNRVRVPFAQGCRVAVSIVVKVAKSQRRFRRRGVPGTQPKAGVEHVTRPQARGKSTLRERAAKDICVALM